MRLNKGALILTALYVCFFMTANGVAAIASDPKGAFFLEQLSIVPAMLFLESAGLLTFVAIDSWLNSWLFFVSLSLVIVYLFGWAMSAIVRQIATSRWLTWLTRWLNRLDERLLNRLDRN
jgi:hypothetical protein